MPNLAVDLFFETSSTLSPTSRLLIMDDGLSPSYQLIEHAETFEELYGQTRVSRAGGLHFRQHQWAHDSDGRTCPKFKYQQDPNLSLLTRSW